jgi:hypothetical protein
MLFGSFVTNLFQFINQWLWRWRWGLWRWRLWRVSALRKLMWPHQCLQHSKCKYLVSSEICSHFIHIYIYCCLCSTEEEDAEVGDSTPWMTLYLDSIISIWKCRGASFKLSPQKLKMCTLKLSLKTYCKKS